MSRIEEAAVDILITDAPIDTGAVRARAGRDCGAVAEFSGVVRDHNDGQRVLGLHYQCYTEMAEAEARRIAQEVMAEFGVRRVCIVHRVGDLDVGDLAMYVAVTAGHRREAFAAIQAVVDRVKDRVPIWKKERYADGERRWL
jgi:molybdopterin synthase catalytic subunit